MFLFVYSLIVWSILVPLIDPAGLFEPPGHRYSAANLPVDSPATPGKPGVARRNQEALRLGRIKC